MPGQQVRRPQETLKGKPAMAISFACPGCATPFRVTEDMAGKKAKCPKCAMVFTLPETVPAGGTVPGVPSGQPPPGAYAESGRHDPDRKRSDRDDDRRDRDDDRDDEPRPKRSRPRRSGNSMIYWVLGLGGALVVLLVLCGGATAVIGYFVFREIAPANNAIVHAPGVNLPPGAPNRGIRVTEFKGFLRVKSNLEMGDAPFDAKKGFGNKQCKEYVIDLQAGRTYTIDLESNDFDAYLHLEELRGKFIMANDDVAPGNLNSRVIFTPNQTGTYVIVATSLNGGVGRFTLTVRESK
jgi:predicted Zn finger-like uncharacterized protein